MNEEEDSTEKQPLREEVAFELIKLLAKAEKEMSENAFHDNGDYPLAYRIIATIIHVTIFLAGVVGNAALIIAIFRTPALHTTTFFYLQSTSVAFLLVLFAAVPDAIVSHYLGLTWISGQTGCSIMVFVHFLGVNVAALSILAAVLHFCCSIDQHFQTPSNSKAKKIILFLWVFSFVYSAPWLGLTLVKPYQGKEGQEICDFRITTQQYVIFSMVDTLIQYAIPSLMAFIALIAVRNSVRKLKERVKVSVMSSDEFQESTADSNLIARMDQTHEENEIPEPRPAEKFSASSNGVHTVRIYFILWTVVTVMFLSGLPFKTLLVYNCFSTFSTAKPFFNIYFMLFSKTCLFLNSAALPYILLAMYVDVRRSITCKRLSASDVFIDSVN